MAKQDSADTKGSWFDGVKAEFRKIIWPTPDDIRKETTAVVVVSVILGIIIALLDFIVQHGIDFLINL
jgi:preprotein translocase subunit SecE